MSYSNELINYTDSKLIAELESRGNYFVISKSDYDKFQNLELLIGEIEELSSRIVIQKNFDNEFNKDLIEQLLRIILNKVEI